MKILHTISSMGVNSGGTSTCTFDLANGLNDANCATEILTIDVKCSSDKIISNDEFLRVVSNDRISKYGYSRNFKHAISLEDYSLCHINGLWEYVNYISASVSRKMGKPYIVTPHGMLYPQALNQNKLLKKAFLFLQFNDVLRNASCIHVTCLEEMNYYRALGFTNPVAVIPNPIIINNFVGSYEVEKGNRRFGFLGRLHPRKKVLELIYAWSKLGDKVKDAELIIVGSGDAVYEDFLKREVQRLNLNNVIFEGFLSGKEKFDMLSSLTALVVPSDFENFGMIVVEALIMKTPVIASKGTPWEELEKKQCGWWVENDIDSIATTINKVLLQDNSELKIMGENGFKLVQEKYIIEKVTEKMIRLYNWILNGGETPEFVYLKNDYGK